MPSENKTPHIGLNQWEGNEYVKRQDFVDDNLIIDAELKKLQNATIDIGGLADAAFQSGVDRKHQAIVNINSMGGRVDDSMQFSKILDEILGIETGIDTSDATATAAHILTPETAYVKGKKVIGGIPVRTNSDTSGSYPLAVKSSYVPGTVHLMPPAGYYNGNVWARISEPDLQPANFLAGKKIGDGSGGVVTGSIPIIGKQVSRVSTKGGRQTISKGYHDGTGYIDYDDANHVAANIKDGVVLGGVMGTLTFASNPASYAVSIPNTTLASVQTLTLQTINNIPAGYRSFAFNRGTLLLTPPANGGGAGSTPWFELLFEVKTTVGTYTFPIDWNGFNGGENFPVFAASVVPVSATEAFYSSYARKRSSADRYPDQVTTKAVVQAFAGGITSITIKARLIRGDLGAWVIGGTGTICVA